MIFLRSPTKKRGVRIGQLEKLSNEVDSAGDQLFA